MAYITAEKDNVIYWAEVGGVLDIDREVERLEKEGFNKIHLWAMPPSWDSTFFREIYSPEMPELNEYTVGEED
jgi:hypothetical protein